MSTSELVSVSAPSPATPESFTLQGKGTLFLYGDGNDVIPSDAYVEIAIVGPNNELITIEYLSGNKPAVNFYGDYTVQVTRVRGAVGVGYATAS